ncbi:serine protease, S1-C subfamily, contains C-terminal PDZ domain [Dyadobacter soli]|uniref:Serine protease, S1-C subfamily, contains C-terminal PDZ domain n=1 Tax=Dyadobacter soli TaxID=659014 RepID=A0A1G7M2V9_9BACT|nr:trypsin-like peptidase domain-containing protein [Dyadobacter soli]SDF56087.1 serine protease, S1-C subfamily, contains C-terminal PDZ domain [Dyadobacter soli]
MSPGRINRKIFIWLFAVNLCVVLSACKGQGQQIEKPAAKILLQSFAAKQGLAASKTTPPARRQRMHSFNFRYAAQRATQSTVRVRTTYLQEIPKAIPDFYFDFFDKDVVGPYKHSAADRNKDGSGSASGVLISEDGYIITNYHVIENADKIEVILSDSRSYAARIVGTDKATDLALLSINESGLPFLQFGNSDSLMSGDIALIAGNPLNFTSTITQGIISFKARNIAQKSARWVLQSFIQTDGVVNIGNSGGALVDLDGKLTGIITAIASPNGVFAGYSFAIPVEVVKKTADDLLNYGKARRGSFGMRTLEMEAAGVAELSGQRVAGMLVEDIEDAGSARAAGLEPGDIIIAADNVQIASTAQLSEWIARSHPGQKVTVTFVRNGTRHRTRLQLDSQSD